MADFLGTHIRKIATYPGALLAKTKITPNQLTVVGLLANCMVAFLIFRGIPNRVTLGVLIWIAGFIDALDGSLARQTNRMTKFGNFLDSVLDRYSDSVIYIGIAAYFLRSWHAMGVMLAVLAMAGSLIVSYARAKAESLGAGCAVGALPRAARIAILGAAFCVGQIPGGLLLVACLSHMTAVQRMLYVRKQLGGGTGA